METAEGLRIYNERFNNNNSPEPNQNSDSNIFFPTIKNCLALTQPSVKNVLDEHKIKQIKNDPKFEEIGIKVINGNQNLNLNNGNQSPALKNEVLQKEPKKEFEIDKLLFVYVKENIYQKVKETIEESKKNGKRMSDIIFREACRDAILEGNKELVQLFLDQGLNPNEDIWGRKDRAIEPLIFFAAQSGNLDIVKLLIHKGAIVEQPANDILNSKRDNQSAMRAAIEGGFSAIVDFLLENGADSNGYFPGWTTQTFLGKAAFLDQKNTVDSLIRHGAKIDLALAWNNKIFRKSYKSPIRKKKNGFENIKGFFKKNKDKKSDLTEDAVLPKDAELLQNYSKSVQILLDYGIGLNFKDLYFLKDLNLEGFNFLGISLKGLPITQKILKEHLLQGYKEAITTLDDLDKIEEADRRNALKARLEVMMELRGKLISKKGIVNLVPLGVAAKKGLIDIVKLRLCSNNQDQNENDSALINAAKNGFHAIVKLLNENCIFSQEILQRAAEYAQKKGYQQIFSYLIPHIDVNKLDMFGQAPIHRAVGRKDLKEIEQLLNRGADINFKTWDKYTPLVLAAGKEEEDLQLIKFLISKGADPNLYSNNYSPLLAAAAAGSFQVVELLLPLTEKRDVKEKEGIIPWYVHPLFSSFGSKEWLPILSLLKKHRADLNARCPNSGVTLLDKVILRFPSITEIRRVISSVGMAVIGCNHLGKNPLQNDYERLVEKGKNSYQAVLHELDFLLENGANPAIKYGTNEITCLHAFSKKADLSFIPGATEEVIERLLKYGANLEAPDIEGFTPLHYAVEEGNLPVVAFLIKKGADIHKRSKTGLTPLHIAAAGLPETTKILIKAGANIFAVDNQGLDSIKYSQQKWEEERKRYKTFPEDLERSYLEAQKLINDLRRPFEEFAKIKEEIFQLQNDFKGWDQTSIAKDLWLDESCLIAEDIVKKVNNAHNYLEKNGFKLKGIKADGNCFFNAYLGSCKLLSRKIPLLEEAENKIFYLRQQVAAQYESTPNGFKNPNRSNQIRKDAEWISASDEGDLLASIFDLPIRVLSAGTESVVDMLTFSKLNKAIEEWDKIPEIDRPTEYIFIVDLGGHFVHAIPS